MDKKRLYEKRKRQQKMLQQKMLGILLLAVCVVMIIFAMHGTAPEERDATAVLFLAPIGLYALLAKECIIG